MSETSINIRVTMKEKDLADKLADYLYKTGRITKHSLSEVMRMALHVLADEAIMLIETQRSQHQ